MNDELVVQEFVACSKMEIGLKYFSDKYADRVLIITDDREAHYYVQSLELIEKFDKAKGQIFISRPNDDSSIMKNATEVMKNRLEKSLLEYKKNLLESNIPHTDNWRIVATKTLLGDYK